MDDSRDVRRRYTGGQIAMLVIGVILLLPGLCSLFFVIGMASEFRGSSSLDQAIAVLWLICFLISAAGVWLIHAARKGAAASASGADGGSS